MEFREVPAEEAAVRRYLEEVWLPYQHALVAAIDWFEIADDVDVVDSEVEFHLNNLESDSYRLTVAVDPPKEGAEGGDFAEGDGDLVGCIATDVDDAPDVFVRPDRLLICELYVREEYRGEGLAEELLELALDRARQEGCSELRLEVALSNERAVGFYEKVGFEGFRQEMLVDADDLSERIR